MEDKDESDSKKAYRVFNNNIIIKRSLLHSYDTLDYTRSGNRGRTIQNVAMAGVHNRPSFGLSCW